jgi:ABC-type nickel/cobalt efflux system permease component RcnA
MYVCVCASQQFTSITLTHTYPTPPDASVAQSLSYEHYMFEELTALRAYVRVQERWLQLAAFLVFLASAVVWKSIRRIDAHTRTHTHTHAHESEGDGDDEDVSGVSDSETEEEEEGEEEVE